MIDLALWTILPMALCATICASLGVWLVLMRGSMMGDGMSHGVLPGLVIVFALFGTRAPGPMLVGALLAALVTVGLTHVITDTLRVPEDAALGAVFTTLFAVGVLLIQRVATQVDLDPGCVLYGLVEFIPLDTMNVGGYLVPSAMRNLVPLGLVVALFLILFRRELCFVLFDSRLAATLGFRPSWVRFGLLAMVALATVVSFELVGAVLVIALLVAPAAAAQLLTRRLQAMFGWANGIAIGSSIGGYYLALATNTSVAGCVAVVCGVAYGGAALLAKQRQASLLRNARRYTEAA